MATQSRFARMAREVLVITASILLAFALDASWARTRDRVAEQELLVALLSEFEGVESELLRARGVHESRGAAAAALLGLIETESPLPSPDSLWALLAWARSPTMIDPPSGVLMSAINGGSLGLIQDDSLRILLAGWPGRVEDHRQTEDNVRVYSFEVLRPWHAEHGINPPLSGPSQAWSARAEPWIRSSAHAGHLWGMARTAGLLRANGDLMELVGHIRHQLTQEMR